jgi:hypothetical protein
LEEEMGSRSKDDGDEKDINETADALNVARQHLLEFEKQLEQLQQQLLARGTRQDVLRQARQALDLTMHKLDDDLKSRN